MDLVWVLVKVGGFVISEFRLRMKDIDKVKDLGIGYDLGFVV